MQFNHCSSEQQKHSNVHRREKQTIRGITKKYYYYYFGGGKGINLTNMSNRGKKPLGEMKTDLFRNYSCFPKLEYNEKFIY